jgi:tripartite-type tricarboxylate transporter receptor subunit TctC
MKLTRRKVMHLAAGAAALPAAARSARAETYPARPVKIISGYPPGGSVDTYARLIGAALSDRLGQQFVVENRPGAGGTIAAAEVAKSAPDGYTLLLTTSADAWNTTLYDNLNFDFVRDFALIATISRGPGVLVVNPSVPAKSVPELIAAAKSNPGKIAVASAGIGSAPYMYWELFRSMTGVDMVHVPYLSWRWARDCRPAWRASPGVLRHLRVGDPICQGGKVTGTGRNQRNTRVGVARCSGLGRIPAGL